MRYENRLTHALSIYHYTCIHTYMLFDMPTHKVPEMHIIYTNDCHSNILWLRMCLYCSTADMYLSTVELSECCRNV